MGDRGATVHPGDPKWLRASSCKVTHFPELLYGIRTQINETYSPVVEKDCETDNDSMAAFPVSR